MPDFFSRLVGRTYGLVPVAQPVARSIFAPEPSIVSDFPESLVQSRESVNPSSAYPDSFQKPRITSQDRDQSLSDQQMAFNRNGDNQIEARANQRNFISSSESQRNTDSLKRDNSGLSKQPIPTLGKRNEEDNPHLNTSPVELAQNNEYKISSDTLEIIGSEPVYQKNKSDQNPVQLITKSIFKEKVASGEPGSQEKPESLIKSVDGSEKPLLENASNSEYGSDSSLKSVSPIKDPELLFQNNDLSSRADFSSSSLLNPYTSSSSGVPNRRNLKQTSTPKGNASLEQMSNLIEKNAASPRFSSNPPTIKVTIGRIEVRAVSPPVKTQPQKPPKEYPVFSLDDYLKQQNGG